MYIRTSSFVSFETIPIIQHLSLADLRFLVIWRLAHWDGQPDIFISEILCQRQLRTKILRRDVPVETFFSSIFLQSIIAHVDYTNVISQFWNVLFIGGSDKTLVYSLTSSLTS